MKRMLSTKIIFPLTLTNNLMKDINECVFQDLCKIKPNKHKERLQAQLQTNSLLKPFFVNFESTLHWNTLVLCMPSS